MWFFSLKKTYIQILFLNFLLCFYIWSLSFPYTVVSSFFRRILNFRLGSSHDSCFPIFRQFSISVVFLRSVRYVLFTEKSPKSQISPCIFVRLPADGFLRVCVVPCPDNRIPTLPISGYTQLSQGCRIPPFFFSKLFFFFLHLLCGFLVSFRSRRKTHVDLLLLSTVTL